MPEGQVWDEPADLWAYVNKALLCASPTTCGADGGLAGAWAGRALDERVTEASRWWEDQGELCGDRGGGFLNFMVCQVCMLNYMERY